VVEARVNSAAVSHVAPLRCRAASQWAPTVATDELTVTDDVNNTLIWTDAFVGCAASVSDIWIISLHQHQHINVITARSGHEKLIYGVAIHSNRRSRDLMSLKSADKKHDNAISW